MKKIVCITILMPVLVWMICDIVAASEESPSSGPASSSGDSVSDGSGF